MKNCVKLSSWWFLLLLLTLFACTPGDIIETTRPSSSNPSATPISTQSTLLLTTPTITIDASSTPTTTPTASTDLLLTFTPTASPLPTFTTTPLLSNTPEPTFTPSPTPIPPTRQFLPPPCPEQLPSPAQNLKIFFSQDGELRRWEDGITTTIATMNGRRIQVLDNGNLILFTRDYELWAINSDGSQERFLTDKINENYLSVSDDGTIIAFVRGNELWAINSDGSQERLLVSESDLAAMPPTDPGVGLKEIYWIPCTHQLMFNTHIRYESGIGYTDDLYLVDTDTLLMKNIFPPEKGGSVFFSPNGQQMALVKTSSITLANYDGSSPQVVLTYPQISTNGPTYLYPRPMWSPDSQSLYVVIPPSDPMQDNPGPTVLWNLPAYGVEAVKLLEFEAAWNNYSVAPDFSLIVYPTMIREGENASQIVHIIQLDGTEITSFPARGYYGLFSWSPDVAHYIFPSDGEFYVGNLAGESVQIMGVDRNVRGLSWIDNSRFLVYHSEAGQEKLSIGTIEGELLLVAQGNIETYAIVR